MEVLQAGGGVGELPRLPGLCVPGGMFFKGWSSRMRTRRLSLARIGSPFPMKGDRKLAAPQGVFSASRAQRPRGWLSRAQSWSPSLVKIGSPFPTDGDLKTCHSPLRLRGPAGTASRGVRFLGLAAPADKKQCGKRAGGPGKFLQGPQLYLDRIGKLFQRPLADPAFQFFKKSLSIPLYSFRPSERLLPQEVSGKRDPFFYDRVPVFYDRVPNPYDRVPVFYDRVPNPYTATAARISMVTSQSLAIVRDLRGKKEDLMSNNRRSRWEILE